MMEFKAARIDAFMKNPVPAVKAVLIHGSDEGMVREYACKLVAVVAGAVDDVFNIARLDDKALLTDPGLLADEARAISLMGGRRVVWIGNAGKGLARAAGNYLPEALGDSLIVAEAGWLRKTDPLRRLFERRANALAVACYPDDTASLRTLILGQLEEHGLTIAADALARLQSRVGADRMLSRSEVEKLVLYCHGQNRVTLRDVDAIGVDTSSLALESMLDAVFEGNPNGAEKTYERLTGAGLPVTSITITAANHIALLQRLKARIAAGQSAQTVVASARPPIFFARRTSFLRQLGLWTIEALFIAADNIGDAELKTREHAALAADIVGHALLNLACLAQSRSRRGSGVHSSAPFDPIESNRRF
ncbi:MAG: DNA polymerase III subunit delta [Hyphomicrobiales bacterium]